MAERLARTPEPELMDRPDQVAAYAGADFADSNQEFVDFLVARLADTAPGRLIDLGCGPADICVRLARALPDWKIVGIDAGDNMLAAARERVRDESLEARIELRLSHLPDPTLDAGGYQCVVSNSLLHHLPDPGVLWRAVAALAAPQALVQVMDLARPDSEAEAAALVDRYAGDEPDVLRTDFRNSLHAAWRVDEVVTQLQQAGLDLACELVSDRHWMVRGRIAAPNGNG